MMQLSCDRLNKSQYNQIGKRIIIEIARGILSLTLRVLQISQLLILSRSVTL